MRLIFAAALTVLMAAASGAPALSDGHLNSDAEDTTLEKNGDSGGRFFRKIFGGDDDEGQIRQESADSGEVSADPVAGGGGTPWINELHYDNAGADTGEFFELAGPAGLDLTGGDPVGRIDVAQTGN